jgi:L-lysine exporter family protein LysE/ArgO
VSGLTLGLGAAAPIGPVNVEIARRALRGGFWAGFALGCGAVTIDVTYAILSSLSLGPLVGRRDVQLTIGIAGFVLLVYLGLLSLASAKQHLGTDPLKENRPAESAPAAHLGAYQTGLLMTLVNPMTLLFWFIVLPGRGANTQDPRHDLPMICAGVFIGTLGWVVAFSGFLGWLGRWRRNWWMAAADGLGGLMLLTLAFVGLWRLIRNR